MNFVIATLKKDIARWRQDATAILLWLSIPLLVGGLISSMAGGDGPQPVAKLLLVDQDDSMLSGLVAGAYGSGQLGELIRVEKVSLEEGTERIDAGDASGLLVIPNGFGDAFVNNQPIALTLKTNPAQTILPGIITNVTEVLLDAGFYAQQLFGDEISKIMGATGSAPDDALVAAISVDVNNKIESVAPQLFPPAIDVEIVEPPPSEPSPPLALLFLPGIVLMGTLFAANGMANDYWTEREHGTLRRLMIAPGRLGAFVAGKALAAAAVIAVVGGLTLTIGFIYSGISWLKFPSSLFWIVVSGAVLFIWFAVLQMSFSTQKAASVVSMLILFPLLMAGGSFFPLAVLPGWIAAIGRVSPNGFVVDKLTTELTAAGVWTIGLNSWAIVIAAGLVGLGLSVWRLRSGFARS